MSKLNLSPVVKCGHPLSSKVRKVGPLNQISFLTKSFNKNPFETISAGIKFELTKRQELMNKISLIYCTRACINDVVNILYPCISNTRIRPTKTFFNTVYSS